MQELEAADIFWSEHNQTVHGLPKVQGGCVGVMAGGGCWQNGASVA